MKKNLIIKTNNDILHIVKESSEERLQRVRCQKRMCTVLMTKNKYSRKQKHKCADYFCEEQKIYDN